MPARTSVSRSKKPTAKSSSARGKAKSATTTRNRRSEAPPPPTLPAHKYLSGNALVCGDNLDVLKELPSECIDLIYLDPPFNSDQNYVAVFGDKGSVDDQLRDIWRWNVETENAYQRLTHRPLLDAINGVRLISGETSRMSAYAVFMGRRLVELHRVLKPTGSIYLHCDPTANWLLRLLLNVIFGEKNFKNEIIWHFPDNFQGNVKRFAANHNTVFYYARPGFTFNKIMEPLDKPKKRGGRVWSKELGKVVPEKGPDGKPVYREYTEKKADNVWVIGQTSVTKPQSQERVGYPTQKPLALLERIVQASSNPGDIVLDPFCGCGTAADAAAKLGRKYLGIDISAIAVRVMQQRLESRGGSATPVIYKMGWDDYEWEQFEQRALLNRNDAEDGVPGWAWAEDKVAGLLNAVPNSKKTADGGADARYFTEKGEVIPIQVKMHRNQIGTPDMDNLLGVMTKWKNQKVNAPMSLMVTLYPPSEGLRVFAARQGQVTLQGHRYPKMQILSVQEMLTKEERPKLPPVDPRYFVGDTQTRFALSG